MLRIAVLLATGLIVVSLLWASLFYFRLASAPDARKLWYKATIYACIGIHVWAIVTSPAAPGWALLLGVGAAGSSVALFWSAVAAHGRQRPAYAFVRTPPERLVRTGPYRLVRHPFYASFMLAALAGTAASGRPALLLTVAWLAVLYRAVAREEEEAFMSGDLAEEYVAYRTRTGMFVPRLTPGRRE